MQDAISYKRFSSPKQARGHSERRQADLTEDYCKRHDLRIIDTYLDAGLSGFTGRHLTDRGALRALLDAARAGKFKQGTHLIVEALDRLSRQEISAALRLFLDILETGLVIVTLMDGEQVFTKERIDSDLAPIIIAIVCLSRANNEARVRRERTLHAQQVARRKARERLIPITAECPRWLALLGEGDDRHFVVDESRARVIRHIFRLSASGLGLIMLARYLNEHKVPTFSRAPIWRPGMIAHLLQNRAVLGVHQPRLSVVEGGARRRRPDPEGPIEGYYPPIVDVELFNKVQLGARSRQRHYGRRVVPAHSNLLTRLGRCAVCSGPLYLSQTVDGFDYLRCTNVRERLCSNVQGFQYRKLEAVLLALDRLIQLVARLIAASRADVEASATGVRQERKARPRALDLDRQPNPVSDYDGFLARFTAAKMHLASDDVETRHRARAALAEEFRKLFAGMVLHRSRLVSLHAHPDGSGWDVVYLLTYEGLRIQTKSDDGVTGLIETGVLAQLVRPPSTAAVARDKAGADATWEARDLDWLMEHVRLIRSTNGDWQAVLSNPLEMADVVARAEDALMG